MAGIDDWEKRLWPQLLAVDLIGELQLAPPQVAEIGQQIAPLLRTHGIQEATRILERRYPGSFVAYLVFQGGSSYDRGDFWAGVFAGVSFDYDANHTLLWGQAFERITHRLGIQHAFAGHRYVGAILGHGGIPAQSLPDFFEFMLQPSVAKPDLAALSTHDLIQEWLDSSAQYHVDKPILRFLEYGGQVAVDFVERCRRLAKTYVAEGEVPPAGDAGLPEALVDAYQDWVERTRVPTASRGTSRLRKPRLLLDPWGLGVYLLLPEQQLSAAESQAKMCWEVQCGAQQEAIDAPARRVDMYLKTKQALAILQQPADRCQVRLCRRVEDKAAEVLQEWDFEGPLAPIAFLVFDATTGDLLPRPRRLPAGDLWLLCAPGVVVSDTTKTVVTEKLPQLPWDWHVWQGYRVRTDGLTVLKLAAGSEDREIPVASRQPGYSIELVHGRSFDSLGDTLPLFTGRPPDLRISAAPGASCVHLDRWRFQLSHEWNADPQRNVKQRLVEFGQRLRKTETEVELALDGADLLGAAPVGQYHLRLQGQLGCGGELRFRVAPRFDVTGHEQLYLPDAHRAPVATLLVETDDRSRLELLEADTELRLELHSEASGTRWYQVTVSPRCAEAALRLVRDVGAGGYAYIPLRIPIHRFRWWLVLNPEKASVPDWRADPLALNLTKLEQSDSPYLLVELPQIAQDARLRLCFNDESGAAITEIGAPQPRDGARVRRIDLRAVRDALRASESPEIRAQLRVDSAATGPLTLAVCTIQRSIHVSCAVAAMHSDGDRCYLDVAWEPEIPLRWRQIYLWTLTQPWRPPQSLSLPDGARGSHSFQVRAEDVPVGQYLLEFAVRDPWLATPALRRPALDAPYVAQVTLGSLAERLAELAASQPTGAAGFAAACERVFIWRALEQREKVETSLQECWGQVDSGDLEPILALEREFRDHLTIKAMRLKIYKTEQIRAILAGYQAGKVSQALIDAYLGGLPPLTKLAPAAQEALLDVPDARVQLAAARLLVERGNLVGIKRVFEWEHAGRLAVEDLAELMRLNIALTVSELKLKLGIEESLRLLHATEDKALQLGIALSLIQRKHADAVLAVVRMCERGVASTWDALGAFAGDPAFVARVLAATPSAATRRLREELVDAFPDADTSVQPGMWVRNNIGWARIECIETREGRVLPTCDRVDGLETLQLRVTFEPGPNALTAIIDVGKKQIVFPQVQRVYQCTKCGTYIAPRYDMITGAHDRAAHEGRNGSFRILPNPVSLVGTLEFRRQPSTKA